MYNYNTYYQEEESYFGEPYAGFMYFFSKNKLGTTVLDLGCGQGRDAIALARLGYEVMGIDNSSVGIEQMLEVAQKENLKISGAVDDIYEYPSIGKYDIVLLDSMFHFYKNDQQKEEQFLSKILDDMKKKAVVCILVLKSVKSEKIISSILDENNFEKIEERYVDYKEANAEYKMFVYRK